MKKVLKGSYHLLATLGFASLIVFSGSAIISLAATIPTIIYSCKLNDDIFGNKINDSIFSVYRSGKIVQNSVSKPSKLISILGEKNKMDRFMDEALTMFIQLKQKNKFGDTVRYKTKSQALTLQLLRKLQNKGYVSNLEYEKAGNSRLILEKLLFGNTESLNKKSQMYNISFNVTDKEKTKEGIKADLLPSKTNTIKPIVTEKKPEVKTDLEEKRKGLVGLKEALNSYRNPDKTIEKDESQMTRK